MLIIDRYTNSMSTEWNEFVRQSKNGMFLFHRSYQDYHADRYADHSYLIRHKGRLCALLPATRSGNELWSHGGLTFGGFVTNEEMTQSLMLEVVDQMLVRLKKDGVHHLHYKAIPPIYHRTPAQEDLYALHCRGARICRRDVNSVLRPGAKPRAQQRRRRGVRDALEAGLTVARSDRWEEFWPLLEQVLLERHSVRPVHTVEEITLLAGRFATNIHLYVARDHQEVVAGSVIYENPCVAHAQYIASSPAGRKLCALDLLFSTLIEETFRHKEWFSFGISTTEGGTCLNGGLAEFKESFGARTIIHDTYSITLE